jgi:outer membrane protein
MTRIIVFVLTLFFTSTQAQQLLSVDEAISAALKSNYDIQLVKNDSASYALDAKYVNAAFLPRFNAAASKIWNNNDQRQEFSDGTKRERDDVRSSNLAASVNLNWTLFDGFRMFATREKVLEFTRLGTLAVRDQVVNTVAQVITGYYNIVQQKQSLKAIQEQISINEERVKLADKKLSVGLGSKPELLQARVDLNAQKAAALRQETLIAQLREQLNQLTGQPIEAMYDVTDSIPINLNLQYEALYASIENNPSLQVARKNIDIAKITLKETKADRWPVIEFNSAYNFTRADNRAVVNPFQPLFSQNKGLNYGLSASIPILNGFNTRRLIKQATLDIEYQELVYNNRRSQLDVAINNSFKDYEYQKKALLLEEENIELAKENVFIALERFRQGVSTYLELREAQISLSESYNRLISARYNTKVAETELLRLKGEIVR